MGAEHARALCTRYVQGRENEGKIRKKRRKEKKEVKEDLEVSPSLKMPPDNHYAPSFGAAESILYFCGNEFQLSSILLK